MFSITLTTQARKTRSDKGGHHNTSSTNLSSSSSSTGSISTGVIGGFILFVLSGVIIGSFIANKKSEKLKAEQEKIELDKCNSIIMQCETFKLQDLMSQFNFDQIKDNIKSKGSKWGQETMDYVVKENKILKDLILKYGEEKGTKIFNNEYFLGMTTDELIDAKRFKTTNIEIEVLKTKTKETWIYGNKSSGDVFVFEQGILVRFKDR